MLIEIETLSQREKEKERCRDRAGQPALKGDMYKEADNRARAREKRNVSQKKISQKRKR